MSDPSLRRHLLELLSSRGAHVDFEAAFADLPADLRDARPGGVPYSCWQQLWHLRFTQADILDFCLNPAYAEPAWPQGYWPETAEPPSDEAWQAELRAFRDDLSAMKRLVEDPATDLYAEIPWGDGQTYLREALLVADHNAYHVGQVVLIRRALGAW